MIIFCHSHPEVWRVLRVLLNADQQSGKTIYSTYDFHNDFVKFDVDALLSMIDAKNSLLYDCAVLVQSSDILSRNFQTKTSRLLTYFIVQARQRNVDLYIVSDSIDLMDKRVRRNIDVQMTVDGFVGSGIRCTVFDVRSMRRTSIQISHTALDNGLITEFTPSYGEIIDMEGMLSDYTLEVSCFA